MGSERSFDRRLAARYARAPEPTANVWLLAWVAKAMARAVERRKARREFASWDGLPDNDREALAHAVAVELDLDPEPHGEHGLAWDLCEAAGWPCDEALGRARELARRWANCADGLLADADGLAELLAWARRRMAAEAAGAPQRGGDELAHTVAFELRIDDEQAWDLCEVAGWP
jgi:hypothetical protein